MKKEEIVKNLKIGDECILMGKNVNIMTKGIQTMSFSLPAVLFVKVGWFDNDMNIKTHMLYEDSILLLSNPLITETKTPC